MTKNYFVAYFFKQQDDSCGCGNITVELDSPMIDVNKLNEIKNEINKDTGIPINNIVILNWRRFEDPE